MSSSIQSAKETILSPDSESAYMHSSGSVSVRPHARSRLFAASGDNQQTSSYSLVQRSVACQECVDRRVLAVEEKFKKTSLQTLECLAQGGCGAVYKVKTGIFSRSYAVKTVKPQLTGQKRRRALDNLGNEIDILTPLKHNHIINILHAFQFQEADVLIMPLASGDLSHYLRKLSGRMAAGKLRQLIRDVCAGVSYIHEQGLIHRDIKRSNILLVDNVWKISDFGLTTKQEGKGNLLLGTAGYWSPEVFSSRQYSTGSDCWAMGMLFMKACVYPLKSVDYLIKCKGKKCLVHKTYQDFEQACFKMLFRRINLLVTVFDYRLNEEVDKYCGGFSQVFDNDRRSIDAMRIRRLPDFHARCLVYVLGLLREDPANRITAKEMSDYITA